MQLHIGEDVSIPLAGLICVLNGTDMMPDTEAYIAQAKKRRRFRNCRGAVKSYLLVKEYGREVVYASPIAATTLEKRLRAEVRRDWVLECSALDIKKD